jgi:Reverse transcriptase (RNA-dependent DNA polymerase)
LDPAEAKSYRPISNLSVLSKLLERLVARLFFDYLRSAYRVNHSTVTAIMKVLSDILRAFDSGKLTLLMLLDSSAAFDTVDPDTLLRRLHKSYGLSGGVHGWFASYLNRRTQCVRHGLLMSIIVIMI